MNSQFKRISRAIFRRLWYAPRGYGFPVPASSFDSDYKSGHWNLLLEEQELHRYMIILGQIVKDGRPGTVLDVGCGSGRLAKLLAPYNPEKYLGLDFSDQAINKARSLRLQSSDFILADFEDWLPSGLQANFIVFNESIGYAKDPLKICLKYHGLLKPDGKLIISYYRSGNYKAIWKRINKHFVICNTATIQSENGSIWDISSLSRPCD